MKTYKVTQGQNIYDVSLAIYGSIEGLLDLFAHNPDLSFDFMLKPGEELVYDEDYTAIGSIVEYMRLNKIRPANGERNVYFKDVKESLRVIIKMFEKSSDISFEMSGDGEMIVDWGDNSPVERISLSLKPIKYAHFFDNQSDERYVKIYGEFKIRQWNMSGIQGIVMPIEPLNVEEVVISKNNMALPGLFLFKNTYSVKMNNLIIDTLTPLQDMSLSELKLKQIKYTSDSILDDYFIYIATNNNQRRGCKVTLTTAPSGEYIEPSKNDNGKYNITTGMEAIYVITHEPAWNEAVPWVFDINGTIYKYENDIV